MHLGQATQLAMHVTQPPSLLSRAGCPHMLCRLSSWRENHSLSGCQCLRVPLWLILVLKHWAPSCSLQQGGPVKFQLGTGPRDRYSPLSPPTLAPPWQQIHTQTPSRSGLGIWSVSMLVLFPSSSCSLAFCLHPLCPLTQKL